MAKGNDAGGNTDPLNIGSETATNAHVVNPVDGAFVIDNPGLLFLGDYERAGNDLSISYQGQTQLIIDYFATDTPPNLEAANGAYLTAQAVNSLAGDPVAGRYAQASGGGEPVEIGTVLKLEGSATSTSVSGVKTELAVGSKVFQGDVIETALEAKLGITFIDKTVFSMSSNARMILDELIYDPANVADSSMSLNLVQGAFVFVTGEIAPTGNMSVETPVATMGIRGTTPRVVINTALGFSVFTILQDPGEESAGSYLILNKITGEILARVTSIDDKWLVTDTGEGAVKVTKSVTDWLEDKLALDEITDVYYRARGERTEIDGSNNFPRIKVALDSGDISLDRLDGLENGAPPAQPEPNFRIFRTNRPPIASDDQLTAYDQFVIGGGGTVNIVTNDNGAGVDVDPEGYDLVVTQINGQNLQFVGNTASVLLPSGAILLVSRDGGITYDPNNAFTLLKGQVGADIFEYTIADVGGLTDIGEVTIEIIGTAGNNPPMVTLASDVGEVIPETDSALVTTGSFDIVDIDVTDIVAIKDVELVVVGNNPAALAEVPDNATLLNMFSPLSGIEINATTTSGSVNWAFNSGAVTFNYLAAGESVTLTYTVTVDDGFFGRDQQDIIIEIVGTNDRPTIVASASPESDNVETLIETDLLLATSGSFEVGDLDLSDVVTSTVSNLTATSTTDGVTDAVANTNGENFFSLLTLNTSQILDAGEISDTLDWSFEASSAGQFDYLAKGEVLQLVYTIEIDDQNGVGNPSGSDDEPSITKQTVTVTINGTNDQPTIEASAAPATDNVETMVESDSVITTAGTFAVGDLDVTDVVTSSVVGVVATSSTNGVPDTVANTNANDFFSLLTLNTPQILDNGEIGDTLSWTFESSSADQFDYLANGEILQLVYTIEIDDQNGVGDPSGSDDEPSKSYETVTINIIGTNDQPGIGDGETGTNERPIVIVVDNEETFTEDDAGQTTTGVFAVVDNDASDVLTAQLNAVTPVLTSVDPGTSVSVNGAGDIVVLGTDSDNRTITNAQLKSMFTLRDKVSDGSQGPVTSGSTIEILGSGETTDALHWDFDSGSETFDFLAAGESLTITVDLEVLDDNLLAPVPDPAPDEPSSSFETITIVIEGTNDQPSIAVVDNNQTFTEDDGPHVTKGRFEVADIDTTDILTAQLNVLTPVLIDVDPSSSVSINGGGDIVILGTETDGRIITNEQLKAMFTLQDKTNDGTTGALADGHTIQILDSTETADALHWDFNSGTEAFDFLAAGESLRLTVQVEVVDDNEFAADPDPSPDEPSSSFETITIVIEGTNDQPTISVVDNSQTFFEDDGVHITSGTFDVADIDTTDIVTAKLNVLTPVVTKLDASSSVTVNGSGDVVIVGSGPDGRTISNAQLKSMFTLRDKTNDGTEGPIANGHNIQILGSAETADILHWDFDSGSETFDFLALGETLTLTVDVEVVDNNGLASGSSPDEPSSSFETITIVIKGTNDQPDISVQAGDVAAGGTVETDGLLTLFGKVTVNDLDSSDAVDASVTRVEAEYNRPGEDSSSPVSIVQVGSKDTIVVQRDGHPDGDYTIDNATLLNFMKLADIAGGTAQGSDFSINQDVLILDDGQTKDILHWQFNSSTPISGQADLVEAFEFLGEGETLQLTYVIRVTDDSGQGNAAEREWDEQTVVILITGSNDQPSVSGYVQPAAIAETDSVLNVSGTLTVADVDSSDVVDVTVDKVEAKLNGVDDLIVSDSMLLGFLSLKDASSSQEKTALQTQESALQLLADGEVQDQLNWEFESTATSFDYLSLGETLVITYDLIVNDNNGAGVAESATTVQQIVITINGTNDEPVIDPVGNFAVDESMDGTPIVVEIGEITFDDVDLNNTGHTATISAVSVGGVSAGMTATNDQLKALIQDLDVTKDAGSDNGSLSPTFSASVSLFNYLNPGETVVLTYTLRVDDGDGGFDTETFDIAITGVNSSPQLTDTTGALASYTQGDGAQIVFPNVTISDDDTVLQSASIQITSGFDTATDELGFVSMNGISGSYNQLTGILSLSGSATLSEYQDALRSITFSTGSSQTISETDRDITYTVNDGVSDSNAFTATIDMIAGLSSGFDTTSEPGQIIGTDGNDIIENTPSTDEVFGGDGNDILIGVQVVDFLYGQAGNDFLLGGQGKDILDGGTGDDILNGGAGADTLTGGTGADEFVFDNTSPTDEILDFEFGEDVINVDALTNDPLTVSFTDIVLDGNGNVVGATLKEGTNKVADITFANPIDDVLGIDVIFDANEEAHTFNVVTA